MNQHRTATAALPGDAVAPAVSPLAERAVAPDDPSSTSIRFQLPARPEAGFEAFSTSTIMLVDDEPLNNEVVEVFLQEAGYRSIVATSEPRTAVDLIRRTAPDVVLLDLRMPGVSGYDILTALRRDRELCYVPVIILTAETDPDSRLQALHLGATEFLTKPVDPSELRLRLRNTLALKSYQDRLRYYDPVTGLLNRRRFIDELERRLANPLPPGHLRVLLHLGLDRFKWINDTLGHRAGDTLLVAAANRIRQVVDSDAAMTPEDAQRRGPRPAPLVARLSGDHFGVLLPDIASEQHVDVVPCRLLEAFTEPFQLLGQEVFVTMSIGAAVQPHDSQSDRMLLEHAERAMYHAKKRGRACVEFISPQMNARAVERLSLETELRRAVERGQFSLHFQPKIDMVTRRIAGAEALVRWEHPTLGTLPPARFIDMAEEIGLIGALGEWVLNTAADTLEAWSAGPAGAISLSVNISPLQFRQSRLDRTVEQLLATRNLAPERLVVELTESTCLEDPDASIPILNRLKSIGVKISMDDFGTGYSSLSYLHRLPVDEVKIDRGFVKGLPSQRDSAAIVGAVLAMAHELQLKTVAEGVETAAQYEFLRRRGCSQFQGFLCSRPLPRAAFEDFVAQFEPAHSGMPGHGAEAAPGD